MIITTENLNEILFENQDARLLIEDVVKNTEAVVYYYSGIEIRTMTAIKIWNRAMRMEEQNEAYSVSMLDFIRSKKVKLAGV